MISQRVLGLLTVVLLVGVMGTAAMWRFARDGEPPPDVAALPGDLEGIASVTEDQSLGSQPVVGFPARLDTLHLQVMAAGLAEPSRESRVAVRASGVVQRVMVREGQTAREGDLLVQLDTVQASLNLARARAALLQAQAQYRERMLGGQGILPAEEEAARERIVRTESGLAAAELTLAERELELEFTRVRAPFNGYIADLKAVEGAFLQSGGDVLTLLQLDPIHVRVDVLEAEIGLIVRGGRARIRFTGLGGESRVASVATVNPIVEPESRTGRVTLTLPNPGARILPGSYAAVTIETEALPDRVLIPREAVLTRGDQRQEVIFVLIPGDEEDRGIAQLRPVALGLRNDTQVEVIPGPATARLEPGEIVLVDGHHFLALGTRVHLVDRIRAGARAGNSR